MVFQIQYRTKHRAPQTELKTSIIRNGSGRNGNENKPLATYVGVIRSRITFDVGQNPVVRGEFAPSQTHI